MINPDIPFVARLAKPSRRWPWLSSLAPVLCCGFLANSWHIHSRMGHNNNGPCVPGKTRHIYNHLYINGYPSLTHIESYRYIHMYVYIYIYTYVNICIYIYSAVHPSHPKIFCHKKRNDQFWLSWDPMSQCQLIYLSCSQVW